MGTCISNHNSVKVAAEVSDNACNNQDCDDKQSLLAESEMNKINVYKSPMKVITSQETEADSKPSDTSIQIRVVTDDSEDDSDCSVVETFDERDFIWIPATLASHMGVHQGSLQRDKNRVYVNDEELFMTVETNRSNGEEKTEVIQELLDKKTSSNFSVVLHHEEDWMTLSR